MARTTAQREDLFAAAPTLACIGIALLIALTVQLDTSDSPDSPLLISTPEDFTGPVTIEFWSPAITAPPKEIDRPNPVQEISPVPTTPVAPDQQHDLDFDASSVAMRRLSPSPPDTTDFNQSAASPSSSARRPFRPSNLETNRPEILASAFTPSGSTTIETTETLPAIYAGPSRRPGPTAGQNRVPALATLSRSDNGRAFLAARAEYEAAGPQAPSPSRIPAVSAAGISAAKTMDRALRTELGRAVYRSDWQEVPLDELPDCNPPGRQDLLKKRILLAAPFERECSHQDGSYRFVETRNLGAFLMWSRPNPDRSAEQPQALNVCDVLENALRCLDGSPIEESIAQ